MSVDEQQYRVGAIRGEEFDVKLESMPSSGARWYHAPTPGEPQPLRHDAEPQTDEIGGAVAERFTFSIDEPGKHELHFILKRVWESEPRQHATVTVEVE